MIALPNPRPMITVRTYKDNGPFFGASTMTYQAARLADILRHIRLAMEDCEDYIALFHGTECKGVFIADAEPEPDGEGGWDMPGPCYVLQREPGRSPKAFQTIVELLK